MAKDLFEPPIFYVFLRISFFQQHKSYLRTEGVVHEFKNWIKSFKSDITKKIKQSLNKA